MKEYHNWEEWMKEKLEDEEVLFQEAHWEAAQKLLDEADRNPHTPFWKKWTWGLLALFLLLSSVFFIANGYFMSQKSLVVSEKSATEKTKTSEDILISSNKKEARNPSVSASSLSSNVPIANEKEEAISLKTESNSINAPENKRKVGETTQKISVFPPKENKIERDSKTAILSKSIDGFPATVFMEKSIPAAESGADKLKVSDIALEKAAKSEESVKKPSALPELENIVLAEDSDTKTAKIESANEEGKIIENKKIKTGEITGIKVAENAEKRSENVVFSPPISLEKTKMKRGNLWLFAGTSVQGQSYALSPAVGVSYRYLTGKGFAVTAFSNYLITRKFPNITHSVNQTQYGLGFENTAYVLTTKSLHFAELGLGVSVPYRRHAFFGGVHYARLVYSAATLEVIQTNSFGFKGMTSENVTGYTQGLQKWDAGISLGYGFSLTRNTQLRVSGNTGLRDLTQNAFFGNSIYHRNSQMRVGLAFRL